MRLLQWTLVLVFAGLILARAGEPGLGARGFFVGEALWHRCLTQTDAWIAPIRDRLSAMTGDSHQPDVGNGQERQQRRVEKPHKSTPPSSNNGPLLPPGSPRA
jgi:hypothetical protein